MKEAQHLLVARTAMCLFICVQYTYAYVVELAVILVLYSSGYDLRENV